MESNKVPKLENLYFYRVCKLCKIYNSTFMIKTYFLLIQTADISNRQAAPSRDSGPQAPSIFFLPQWPYAKLVMGEEHEGVRGEGFCGPGSIPIARDLESVGRRLPRKHSHPQSLELMVGNFPSLLINQRAYFID